MIIAHRSGGKPVSSRWFSVGISHVFEISWWLGLDWVFVAVCGLSPGEVRAHRSLVEEPGLLAAVVSLAVEHRLQV